MALYLDASDQIFKEQSTGVVSPNGSDSVSVGPFIPIEGDPRYHDAMHVANGYLMRHHDIDTPILDFERSRRFMAGVGRLWSFESPQLATNFLSTPCSLRNSAWRGKGHLHPQFEL